MRVSVLLSALFIAVTAAGTIPNENAERDLDVAACKCHCDESQCSGPACCANGSCGFCLNDAARRAVFLAKMKQ
ncbi:hypothetical protein CC79DRAFT_1365529 [Sarocladium strictum]